MRPSSRVVPSLVSGKLLNADFLRSTEADKAKRRIGGMRMPGKPSFRVGDAVVVNPGVMDPDEPTLSLAGWQGWVTEIYAKEGTLAFQWDSLVLKSIPADYIRKCE